jgi:hypothetical protein
MRTAFLTTLTTALLAFVAPAFAASLEGPRILKVVQHVSYRAHGLRPGRYALILVRQRKIAGRSQRCVAFVAGRRKVTGTAARFLGSVPDRLMCRGRKGGQRQVATRSGAYQLHACEVGRRGVCSRAASDAKLRVRVT